MSLFIVDEDERLIDGNVIVDIDDQVPFNSKELTERDDQESDDRSIPVTFQEVETVPIYQSREVSCTLPLRYQQEILEDMLARDSLLILGRGLGWDIITANLLHALSSPSVILQNGNQKQEKRCLIFLLNANGYEIVRLKEELTELHWIDDYAQENTLVNLGGETQSISTKRKEVYSKGGILSITSRVLVVDILSGIIDPNDITGLFLLHAEKIKETSNESLIINLYRDGNDWGFVKAVSDEPELFTGFTPLASKLKFLGLSNVLLWPRFHVEISSSLNHDGKNLSNRQNQELEKRRFVTEINTKLSYKMGKIQSAILSCIQACLQELKRHNADLSNDYWDMENVHDPEFVLRIRLSVDSQWHRLTYTSKQLIFDLGTLTDLLKQLVSLDSISFYQIVQGIIDQNIKHVGSGVSSRTMMSPWLNLDESNTIIAYSRDRALGKMKVEKKISGTDEYSLKEEYVLEELPKWDQLGLLLNDIMHEKSTKGSKDQGPILIMCASKSTVHQLTEIISTMKEELNAMTLKRRFSSRRYMVSKLNDYLSWKEINSLAKKINLDLETKTEEESRDENEQKLNISKSFSRNSQPVSKRRRTRGASSAARISSLYSGSSLGRNTDVIEIDEAILKELQDTIKSEDRSDQEDRGAETSENVDDVEEIETGGFLKDPIDLLSQGFEKRLVFEHINKDDQIIIQTYDERINDALLQEISPSYIIMYEPNLSFIRRVEIFQAINKDHPAKTYFMYYGNSIEEQKHLLRIKKEKEAFTRLIREKASLGKHFDSAEDKSKFRIRKANVINTRIAGGAKFRSENDELRVIVDVREFRSSLPNLLYRVGVKVIPCMITVGDYIVSPKICVERKSIPDLISSFKSGRLYHQCEQMFRHYELPTLLIEFDESKSFSLEPFTESRMQKINPINPTSTQILQKNIQSNIMSLLISFPKLKIIWSSSPYETAQIFLKLKANQEEPDVGSAIDKGVNKLLVTEDGGPPVFNEDPIDFIQSIPGINNMNYHLIIQRLRNIEKLVKLSKEQFEDILGEENGRKAYNFINHQVN